MRNGCHVGLFGLKLIRRGLKRKKILICIQKRLNVYYREKAI